MYSAILIFHIVISILLVCIAFYIVVRSLLGVFNKISFSSFSEVSIPVFAVVLLYLELILGMILYAIHINKLETLVTQDHANMYFSARFWAVEHTILMLFAIVLVIWDWYMPKTWRMIKRSSEKTFYILGSRL